MELKDILIGSILAVSFALIALITGYAIVFLGLAWVTGASTLFGLLLRSEDGKLNVWHKIIIPTGTVLIVILTLLALFYNVKTVEVESNYYEMYHVTAPFGVIWVEQTGSFRGSFLAFSGKLNSELVNSYVVKFMVGNELQTVITEKPLVIDGTFTLEEKTSTPIFQNKLFYNTASYGDSITEWIVHLPSLPSVNKTDGDYHIVP